MAQPKQNFDQNYIGGKWVSSDSGEFIDVVNPATEEVIGRVPASTVEDVDRAVREARGAFDEWSQTTVETRLNYLQAIVSGLEARSEEIVGVLTAEVGAPTKVAAGLHLGLPISAFTSAIDILRTFEFEYEINGAQIVREPIGVVGAITPWNVPLNQIAWKVAPALATGCTVVLKASEVAPLVTSIFAEIVDTAGLPPGVFNLVHGTGPVVGEAIAAHPDVDMVSFTGSTGAGRRVSEVAARTIKRVGLELGGKSANIILDDADIVTAVAAGVSSCYANSGQVCSAQTRMLVPRNRLGEVEELAKAAADSFTVGDPLSESTKLGPVISEVQRDRVRGYIEKGIAEGAKLIAGGPEQPAATPKGYFVQPTVFSDVTPDMVIAREEIFGPVLTIIAYDSESEAIDIANDSVYGLGGAVWAGSDERAREVAKKMRTGQVYTNGARVNTHAPFGGYKQSGNGREWGPIGFEEYLEIKAIL